MKRGEIWWANLSGHVGPRPVVLLSRNEAYDVRNRATVVSVTTRIRGLKTEVRLDSSDGLKRVCAANADDLLTIPLGALERRMAKLSAEKLSALEDAVRFALALE